MAGFGATIGSVVPGLGTGVGRALDRLAQYYIKLAENTFPVIEVDAGREIDVVITKGVRMKISTWRRMDPNINPVAAKGTGIYINSSLAKVEALHGGYDEAILLNTTGSVAEALGKTADIVYSVLKVTKERGQRELALVPAQDQLVDPAEHFEVTAI